MTTHTHPSPIASTRLTLVPLRRSSLGSRYPSTTESRHGKWFLAALLVLLTAAVVVGLLI
jgi:hypothetical protein